MNWITVIFQVINFLVLVWLLQRFLYRPIISAMEKREKGLASEWDAAREKQRLAAETRSSFEAKQAELEHRREEFLAKSRTEADELKVELAEKARREIEELRQRWAESLVEQKDSFLQEVRQLTAEGACRVAREALADMAKTPLESRVSELLVEKLQELPSETIDELSRLTRDAQGRIRIRSSAELPESTRNHLTTAVQQHISGVQAIEFETEEEITCGIELLTNSHKLSWTLDSYVDGIEERLEDLLSQRAKHQ
ncbi:MAG: hypothetical protein ACFCD0_07910 [Gemmataceae bacterium]